MTSSCGPFRRSAGPLALADRGASQAPGRPNFVLLGIAQLTALRDEQSAQTEPRGVVGFEVILGALLAALDGDVRTSIHAGVEQRHRLF